MTRTILRLRSRRDPIAAASCDSNRRRRGAVLALAATLAAGCAEPRERGDALDAEDAARVTAEVETAVLAFHAADTARDAEAVIALLWPDFTMLVDGARTGYAEVVEGSRAFMSSIDLFHTEWNELQILPLGRDVAVSSFLFRDSIRSRTGEVTRSRGPTTFVWQRRDGEWRVVFADADHYAEG